MQKIFKTIIFSLLLLQNYQIDASPDIAKITNIEDIQPYITKDTLFVFDIDDVLVTSHISWIWDESFLKSKFNLTDAEYHSQESWNFFYKLRFPMQYQLVDEKIKGVFENLKKQETKVIALTARGIVENNLEIYFSHNNIYFDPSILKNNSRGIICANQGDKGEYLFNALVMKPQYIVFVDDMMYNCKSVLRECKNRQIPCQIFHYTKNHFKQEIAELQFQIWQQDKILISDAEAEQIYQNLLISKK